MTTGPIGDGNTSSEFHVCVFLVLLRPAILLQVTVSGTGRRWGGAAPCDSGGMTQRRRLFRGGLPSLRSSWRHSGEKDDGHWAVQHSFWLGFG